MIPDPEGGPDPVVGPLLSIGLNELHKDQQDIVVAMRPEQFYSVADFAYSQYNIITQSLETPIPELSLLEAQREVYALHDLKSRLVGVVHCWNQGPFVLAHSDLRPSNIIVDDDLNIQGIIDWEWAGTIPCQLFMPPTWLVGERPCFVASTDYSREYAEFYAVLAARNATANTSASCYRQLAEEWGPDLPYGLELPLAVALQHHSQFVTTYYLAIYPKFFKASSAETVSQFFKEQQDGDNSSLVLQARRHAEASVRYTQYLQDYGLFVENERVRKMHEWLEQKRQKEMQWEKERQQLQLEHKRRRAELEARQKTRRDELLNCQTQSPSGPSSHSPNSLAPPPCFL